MTRALRPRLYTIPLSHYCERARWALDFAGIDYDEEQHLQFFASRVVREHGGKSSVPILVAGGTRLYDSGDILEWAAHRATNPLFGTPPQTSEIRALSDELAGRYGDETRRLAYDYFFRCIRASLPYNMGAAPQYEVWSLRLLRPIVQPRIHRFIGLAAHEVQRAYDFVRSTLDTIGQRLADGRPYLCGDTFTAADLTFATLTSVLVAPPRYPVPLPPPEQLDASAQALIHEAREHPAGRHALALYAERPSVRARLRRPLRIEPPAATS